MEISLKKTGLGLLVLVAVLVLANIFVIMPFLSLKPMQTPSVQEEAAEERVKPAAVAPVTVDSLAVILQKGVVEGVIARETDKQNLRNPFFEPKEKLQQKKTKETAADKPAVVQSAVRKSAADKPEPPKPQLSMVIISQGRKQAILDDVFIREGDMFHGYRVKRILDNEVVLSGKFGDLRIILGSGEETEQQAPPPAGLMEQ